MKTHTAFSRAPARQQRGAVLVISLVFLLILTTLAVTNMREVALESRVTGNLVNQKGCFDSGEAGLRDGEYRVFGKPGADSPGDYQLQPIANYGDGVVVVPGIPLATQSCPTDLTSDQPCVLDQDATFTQSFAAEEPGFAGVKLYAPDDSTEFEQDIVWYALYFTDGADQGQSETPEYGALEGLNGAIVRAEINASASDDSCRVDLRSTTAHQF